MPTIFDDRADNDKFMEWTEANSMFGFYLNVKTLTTAVLHKAKCKHKWEQGGSNTENKKVCSRIKADLLDWAKGNGVSITECKDC